MKGAEQEPASDDATVGHPASYPGDARLRLSQEAFSGAAKPRHHREGSAPDCRNRAALCMDCLWEPQLDGLRDGFRVIAPDLQGFGARRHDA